MRIEVKSEDLTLIPLYLAGAALWAVALWFLFKGWLL